MVVRMLDEEVGHGKQQSIQPMARGGKMESKNRNVWIIVVVILVVACCALAIMVAMAGWFVARSIDLQDLGSFDVGGMYRERVEERFEVGDEPTLDIENFAGSVTIQPGETGVIRVVAVKKANSRNRMDRVKVTMSERGDGVVIETRMSPPASNASVELEITAPADSRVQLQTGAGTVNVRGITGPIDVESGAGQVELRGARGPVAVDLGAGQIIYEGTPSGDCYFSTGAGEITLWLPADLDMEVDLSTGIGVVGVEFRVDGQVKPREVKGVIGDGSQGWINAHTGAGAITLKRQ
jgi:hypothetical protein